MADGGLTALSRELDALGGCSDARISGVDVVVRLTDVRDEDAPRGPRGPGDDSPAVTADAARAAVVLHDSRGGGKRLRVTAALPPSAGNDDVWSEVGAPLLSWLLSGFSAAVVTFGQVRTATRTLRRDACCTYCDVSPRGAGVTVCRPARASRTQCSATARCTIDSWPLSATRCPVLTARSCTLVCHSGSCVATSSWICCCRMTRPRTEASV
jgi:hypothetical protein